MRLLKNRFFLVNGTNKVMETITWILDGTEMIGMQDSRCVSIGEMAPHPITSAPYDKWFPVSAQNMAVDNPTVYTTKSAIRIDKDINSPTYGQAISVQVKDQVVSNAYDYYNLPLKAGYVEITMAQFNDPGYPPPP